MITNDVLSYVGEVSLQTTINNKVYTLRTFNSGTRELSRLFTACVLGMNTEGLVPRYLDIGYFTNTDTTHRDKYNLNTFVSMLAAPQIITGKQYEMDKETGWYVPKMNAVVVKQQFQQSETPETTKGEDTGDIDNPTIIIALMSQSRNIIAYIDTGETSINKIYATSNNLLVNWSMKLKNSHQPEDPEQITDVTDDQSGNTQEVQDGQA